MPMCILIYSFYKKASPNHNTNKAAAMLTASFIFPFFVTSFLEKCQKTFSEKVSNQNNNGKHKKLIKRQKKHRNSRNSYYSAKYYISLGTYTLAAVPYFDL